MIETGTLSYRSQILYTGEVISNQVISNLNFSNPVIFPINFLGSVAYCNVTPTDFALISISVNGTIVGSISFFSGVNFGSFQSIVDINVNIGDVMEFKIVTPDSTISDFAITMSGTVYVAPILFTFLPDVFSYNANSFIVKGSVYPPNTQLCLGFSSNNIDPPTSWTTTTAVSENWSATLSPGTLLVSGIETFIWSEFVSNESIYKICPFVPRSLSITITGIYDGSYSSGFISSAYQNDTISILGNVVSSGNAVRVGLSTTNTVAPTTWEAATVNSSTWSANLTMSQTGTFYVWAEQANHTNISAVSSPIVVSVFVAPTLSLYNPNPETQMLGYAPGVSGVEGATVVYKAITTAGLSVDYYYGYTTTNVAPTDNSWTTGGSVFNDGSTWYILFDDNVKPSSPESVYFWARLSDYPSVTASVNILYTPGLPGNYYISNPSPTTYIGSNSVNNNGAAGLTTNLSQSSQSWAIIYEGFQTNLPSDAIAQAYFTNTSPTSQPLTGGLGCFVFELSGSSWVIGSGNVPSSLVVGNSYIFSVWISSASTPSANLGIISSPAVSIVS